MCSGISTELLDQALGLIVVWVDSGAEQRPTQSHIVALNCSCLRLETGAFVQAATGGLAMSSDEVADVCRK